RARRGTLWPYPQGSWRWDRTHPGSSSSGFPDEPSQGPAVFIANGAGRPGRADGEVALPTVGPWAGGKPSSQSAAEPIPTRGGPGRRPALEDRPCTPPSNVKPCSPSAHAASPAATNGPGSSVT